MALILSSPARGLAAIGRTHRRRLLVVTMVAIFLLIGRALLAPLTVPPAELRVAELGGYIGADLKRVSIPILSQIPLAGQLTFVLPRERRVTSLILEGRPAADEDMAQFASAFPLCETVDVSSTKITDQSLGHIASLWPLLVLKARHTSVTDAGVRNLVRCRQLSIVELDGTQITDAALTDLAKVRRLWRLQVSRTRVTNSGLAKLRGLNLNCLDVSHTDCTAEGIAAFRTANPRCTVLWSD